MVTWAVLVAVACVWMAVFDWPRGLTIGPVTVKDWSATLLLAAFAALWIVLVVRWERRLAARLRAGDYCLCPNCGYALTGHTGETTCPECGRACDIEHAQRQWREYRPPPRRASRPP